MITVYLSLAGRTAESFDLSTSRVAVVECGCYQLERTDDGMTQFVLAIDVEPLRSLDSYAVALVPPSSFHSLLPPLKSPQ